MYQVVYTPTFEKAFKKLDNSVGERIIQKIQWLSGHPEFLNQSVKYVPSALLGLKKYRIGNWRLLFWVNHEKQIITLYLIDHRGSVYTRF